MKEEAGFERLDTPRKCLDWAKATLKLNDETARQTLGLPDRGAKLGYVPGGPFVSTGNKELDAMLRSLVTIESSKDFKTIVDPELELGAAGEAWWGWRETFRHDKTYNKHPRIKPKFVDTYLGGAPGPHYVYCSRLEPGKIIYTPDQESGRADRRVLTTPGRYLTKHHPKLGEAKIKAIAEEHKAFYEDVSVYFAFGADEIEAVYNNGLETCMANKKWAAENPVRVYDGPDVVLAYIKAKNGKTAARALVNIGKTPMAYSRVFGEEVLLTSRLQGLGFVYEIGLPQARLRLAFNLAARKVICPYIDSGLNVCIDGGYLVVTSKKSGITKWRCQNTDGVALMDPMSVSEIPAEFRNGAEEYFSCGHCGGARHQPAGHEINVDQIPICTQCLKTYYVRASYDRSGTLAWINRNNCHKDGENWLYFGRSGTFAREQGFVRSRYTERWIRTADAVAWGTSTTEMLEREIAVQCADALWYPREQCVLDPENRYVFEGRAQVVRDQNGNRYYFDPKHLPACIALVNKGYKYVDTKVKA